MDRRNETEPQRSGDGSDIVETKGTTLEDSSSAE